MCYGNHLPCSHCRPIYAGNALSTVRFSGAGPFLLSIRPTAFEAAKSSEEATWAPVTPLELPEGVPGTEESVGRIEWVGEELSTSERPELGSAKVVVSGGRALKSAENFKMLEQLADKLGGAGEGARRRSHKAGAVREG